MSPTCCVCSSPDLTCARVLGKSELCVDSFMRLWRLPEVVCGCWCVVPMLEIQLKHMHAWIPSRDILKKIFREVMQNLSSPRSLQVLGPKSQAWPILYLPFLASSWLRSIMKLSLLRLFFTIYSSLIHAPYILSVMINSEFNLLFQS